MNKASNEHISRRDLFELLGGILAAGTAEIVFDGIEAEGPTPESKSPIESIETGGYRIKAMPSSDGKDHVVIDIARFADSSSAR